MTNAAFSRGIGALLVAAVFAAFGAAPATAQEEIDLTGEWILSVDGPNGAGTREVTFEQRGDSIFGTISSSMASGPLEGEIDQTTGAVVFVAIVAMGTGDFEILYSCVWQDGELVQGDVDFGDYGSGTFTGARKENGSSGAGDTD